MADLREHADNIALNDKKNSCYAKHIQFTDHEIRRVEVPFGGGGKTLPGYLHLPPNRSGRVPCVWSISALDSNKEGGAGISTATRCASAASPRWLSRDPARTSAPFAKSI